MDEAPDSMQASLEALAALDLAKVDSAVEASEDQAGALNREESKVGAEQPSKKGPEDSHEKDGQKSPLYYSSKELRRMRESKAARRWPEFLDEDFKNHRGHWDPDRWHQGRRRGSTPPPGECKDEGRPKGNKDETATDSKPVSVI